MIRRLVGLVLVAPLALLLSCGGSLTEPTVRPNFNSGGGAEPYEKWEHYWDIDPMIPVANDACDQTIASCRHFGFYGVALKEFPDGRVRANCALLDSMLMNGQGAADNASFDCYSLPYFCMQANFLNPEAGSVDDCLCTSARCFGCDSTSYFYQTDCRYVPLDHELNQP